MKPLLAKTTWNDEYVAIIAIFTTTTDTVCRYVVRSGAIHEDTAIGSFEVVGGLPDHWATDWLEPSLTWFKAWEEKARNG